MRKRSSQFFVYSFFILISLVLIALSPTGIMGASQGAIQFLFLPVQKIVYTAYGATNNNPESKVVEENKRLQVELSQKKELEREVQALRDQFAVTTISTQELIPAQVVGLEAFIPGVSTPERIIIDKGSVNGVIPGQIVVVKDILIGRVVDVSQRLSSVDLTVRKGFSITARTSNTNALGVLKGQGSSFILDNVILSEKLEKNDMVVTKGSMNQDGTGSPPGLVLGKIISVEKRSSALFQTAEVAPLIDPSKLSVVFLLQR